MSVISSSGIATHNNTFATHNNTFKFDFIIVGRAFIIGEIKDPFYDGSRGEFRFQIVDVIIIGLFWADLGVPYFGMYRLNETWYVHGSYYVGINHLRILLDKPNITHVCGMLSGGVLYIQDY